jgi:Flp pilus assembly pilin Flp
MGWTRLLDQIRSDLTGTTTVEYALILAVIFFAMLAAFNSFAGAFSSLWVTTSNQISTSISA